MALVFDLETIGEEWDSFDETTQHALTRWAKRESKTDEEFEVAVKDLREGLGFSPLTGEIVAIGVYDTEKRKGAVYFQAPGAKLEETEEDGIRYKPMGEKEMLENFWEGAKQYREFVTFNGRGFDAPFLAIRSMVHGIRPTKDLLRGRYLYQQRDDAIHIDLQDQLTFYGAWHKRPSIHLFCRALGIESPKEGGAGDEVAPMFKAGQYLDIARYNAGDIRATAALYERWNATLR